MTTTYLRSLFLIALTYCLASPVYAVPCSSYPDPENYQWSVEWTDTYIQTTYSLVAPCKVFVTQPFTVTATVRDPFYRSGAVGWNWAILDTPVGGSTVTLASGGSSWIWLTDWEWTLDIEITYTGIPVDHIIEFAFVDFGRGSGGHSWGGGIIGNLVVDPYPILTPAPTTLALFVLGLAGISYKRYRKTAR